MTIVGSFNDHFNVFFVLKKQNNMSFAMKNDFTFQNTIVAITTHLNQKYLLIYKSRVSHIHKCEDRPFWRTIAMLYYDKSQYKRDIILLIRKKNTKMKAIKNHIQRFNMNMSVFSVFWNVCVIGGRFFLSRFTLSAEKSNVANLKKKNGQYMVVSVCFGIYKIIVSLWLNSL